MTNSLKFDADAMYADLVEHLMSVMDSINQQFFKEAVSALSAEGKQDSDIEKSVLENAPDFIESEGNKFIVSRCKFYAEALMDSFGMGSKADTSDKSYWEDYKATASGHPAYFNPVRTGTEIVGRPRGSYIDIYGKKHSTWGNMAGKSLEDVFKEKIKSPSYSIQRAENWYMKDGYQKRIEGRIEEEIVEFIKLNAKKYFYFE